MPILTTKIGTPKCKAVIAATSRYTKHKILPASSFWREEHFYFVKSWLDIIQWHSLKYNVNSNIISKKKMSTFLVTYSKQHLCILLYEAWIISLLFIYDFLIIQRKTHVLVDHDILMNITQMQKNKPLLIRYSHKCSQNSSVEEHQNFWSIV